jgi:hypothetical protein
LPISLFALLSQWGGGGGVIYSFKLFLPAFAALRRGGGGGFSTLWSVSAKPGSGFLLHRWGAVDTGVVNNTGLTFRRAVIVIAAVSDTGD